MEKIEFPPQFNLDTSTLDPQTSRIQSNQRN